MRLIDADELVRKEIAFVGGPRSGGKTLAMIHSAIRHIVDNAPTVIAEPVRHGHNENREYHEADEFICSECGLHLEDWTRYVYDEDSDEEYAQEYVFKHCPECGAKIGVQ